MNPKHPQNDTCDLTPATQMEAEERALVQDDRCDDYLTRQAAVAEQQDAPATPLPPQDTIRPQVTVNTESLSACHAPTSADEMEAEERELVIENSVDDVLTYAQQPLSDEEIRARALTREADIRPQAEDGTAC
ncbi:hypothetical protein [Paralysiella testudinis]|uniref:Uncharacterized protein n=1 Tax=Paralysiella testudinis TaxID=2809020 RepID=A0A892ZLV1_9NEIS|nr:hypothetical protein [Paralysiella testudinis]QRQ83420.1 hypothetical protein JQU52_05335 [Paralysiella testudinis]